MQKKKWLTLALVGTALLLIPRRSSRQASPDTNVSTSGNTNEANKVADSLNDTKSKRAQKTK